MDFGNKVLDALNGIKLQLLLLSILYVIWALSWPMFNSSMVMITDFALSKFTNLCLLAQISKHCPFISLCRVPHFAGLHGLPYCFTVTPGLVSAFVCFCILLCSSSFSNIHCILPYTGHCLCRYSVPQHLQFSTNFLCCLF